MIDRHIELDDYQEEECPHCQDSLEKLVCCQEDLEEITQLTALLVQEFDINTPRAMERARRILTSLCDLLDIQIPEHQGS